MSQKLAKAIALNRKNRIKYVPFFSSTVLKLIIWSMIGQFPLPVVHNPAYDDHERGQGADDGGDDGSGIV